MIWRKSWWECRVRVLLAALAWLAVSGAALILLVLGAGAKGAAAFWSFYSMILACLITPIVTVMLAGSGINSQTSWGMLRGFHSSMYFLLSLPLSRRRALLVRSALGAMFTGLFIVACVFTVGLTAPFLGTQVSVGNVFLCLPFIMTGAFGFYGFSTFLTIWLDEFWAGSIGLALTGGVFGAEMALWGLHDPFNPAQILSGEHFARTGEIAWPFIVLVLGVGMAFMAASMYLVERKEY